jgi:hypothetical protein
MPAPSSLTTLARLSGDATPVPANSLLLSFKQMQLYVLCGNSKLGINIPFPHVQISQFCSFMLCQKGHILNVTNQQHFTQLISHHLNEVKQNGDQMVDKITEGSQPDKDTNL